jgi:hypothetical protein
MADTPADAQARETGMAPADDSPPDAATGTPAAEQTPAATLQQNPAPAPAPEPGSEPSDLPVEISLQDLTAGGSGDPLFAAAGDLQGVPLDPVLLDDRHEIHPGSPLPELDSPSARAYHAEDRSDPGRPLFALMCIPGMPIRTREILSIAGNAFDNLLPLVHFGHVHWPLAGRQVSTVIYQRPLGGRVIDALADPRRSERARQDLIHKTVAAIHAALVDLMRHGFLHRAIRPGNLFFLDADRENIVLGDAFTAPPGFDQPATFETIERGTASPSGRGLGLPADDAYALGVTLAFLVIGRNPTRHLQTRDLILSKLSDGSYTTLLGRASISPNLREPIRGLLHDDPEQRWGIEDIGSWLTGRRVAPSQTKGKARAERGFSVAGGEYFEPRTVAFALAENPEAAVQAIRDGALERWALRSIEDKDMAAAISAAVAVVDAHRGDPRGTDDVLVTRIVTLLDPSGPIRYKRFGFMPDGFGAALAIEVLRNASGRLLSEVVLRDIPQIWFDAQRTAPGAGATEARFFIQLRGYLQIQEPGFGLLRCLYEVNPHLPCLSPMLESEYVDEIGELLPALDRIAHDADISHLPMDEHIAAFIAAHYDGNVERHLASYGRSNDVEMTVGVLGILSALQDRLGPATLYGLSSWVGGLIGPAIRIYRSRKRRRTIEQEIPRLVREGSLTGILDLLNDSGALAADEIDYDAAKDKFQEADTEIARIEKNILPSSEENRKLGQRSAAVFSVVIAMSVVAIFLIT